MTEAELRARFPAAFNDQRRPLALGVHEALGLPWGDRVLAIWTTHPQYLRNVLEPGSKRIDLNGNVVSEIGPLERRFAWDALLVVRSDLSLVNARAHAEGHKPARDDESRRRMPKRPEEPRR